MARHGRATFIVCNILEVAIIVLEEKRLDGLKQTLASENPEYFFLFHNGITALCERLQMDTVNNRLKLEGLSVVNGCQSLSTILACSEKAKNANRPRPRNATLSGMPEGQPKKLAKSVVHPTTAVPVKLKIGARTTTS